MDDVKSGAVERVKILGVEAAEREARANGVERELRLEREWRTSLQEASISNAEKISQLHHEIDQLRRVSEVRLSINFAKYFHIINSIMAKLWDRKECYDMILLCFVKFFLSLCRILILLELWMHQNNIIRVWLRNY